MPSCPINDQARLWIDQRWEWLILQFGADRARRANFWSDSESIFADYQNNFESAFALFHRIRQHLEIPSERIKFRLFDRYDTLGNAAIQNALGLYSKDDRFDHVQIHKELLGNPESVAATISHELCHVHLIGDNRVSQETPDHEFLTDLLTVFLGCGVLTANNSLQEDYYRDAQLYSWSLRRVGYLTMPMYGYALAKWAILRGEEKPDWYSQLRPDIKYFYRTARRYLKWRETHPDQITGESDGIISTPISAEDRDRSQDADAPEIEGKFTSVQFENSSQLIDAYQNGFRDFQNGNLTDLTLQNVILEDCNFQAAIVTGSDFSHGKIINTSWCDSDISFANFTHADLSDSDFSQGKIADCNFEYANLTSCDLRGTIFIENSFIHANLTNVITDESTVFRNCDFTGVIAFEPPQQSQAPRKTHTLVGEQIHETVSKTSRVAMVFSICAVLTLLCVLLIKEITAYFFGAFIEKHLSDLYYTILIVFGLLLFACSFFRLRPWKDPDD